MPRSVTASRHDSAPGQLTTSARPRRPTVETSAASHVKLRELRVSHQCASSSAPSRANRPVGRPRQGSQRPAAGRYVATQRDVDQRETSDAVAGVRRSQTRALPPGARRDRDRAGSPIRRASRSQRRRSRRPAAGPSPSRRACRSSTRIPHFDVRHSVPPRPRSVRSPCLDQELQAVSLRCSKSPAADRPSGSRSPGPGFLRPNEGSSSALRQRSPYSRRAHGSRAPRRFASTARTDVVNASST